MKSIKKILALFLFLFSCFLIPISHAAIPNLEINDGFYSEVLLMNGKVDIWANPAPAGEIFDQWVGDKDLIEDPHSYHTQMDPPKTSSQINATYKPLLSNWDIITNVTLEVFNGTEVYYYLPHNQLGVVFIFHGRGGSSANWLNENRTESLHFINLLARRGYGIIVCESLDRINGEWDGNNVLENNTDIQNVEYIVNNFTSRGLIRKLSPFFGLGMSLGGAFVSRASVYFDYSAQAIFCASGVSIIVRYYTIPTYWNLAVNDHFPNINPNGAGNFEYYILNGAFAELFMNQPTPVHPKQFSYINGISYDNSSELYDAFRDAHLIDENGYVYTNITSTDPLLEAIPDEYGFRNTSLKNSVMISGAFHKFYSKDIHNVINFFDEHNQNSTRFALISTVDYGGDLPIDWPEVDGKYQLMRYDDDGVFELIWSESAKADNYSIYHSEDCITDIGENSILLANQNATAPFPINMSQFNGYRFFIVIAHRKSGDTPSNCIRVQIGEIPEGGNGVIPLGNFFLIFIALPIIISIISLKKKHRF